MFNSGSGFIGFTISGVGALVFYAGLMFVYDGSYDPGNVIQVNLLSFLFATF